LENETGTAFWELLKRRHQEQKYRSDFSTDMRDRQVLLDANYHGRIPRLFGVVVEWLKHDGRQMDGKSSKTIFLGYRKCWTVVEHGKLTDCKSTRYGW
jgi:hypothetical protein